MKNNWPVKKLGVVAEIIGGGTPSRSKNAYWSGNIPWLTMADLNDGDLYIDKTIQTISAEGLKNSNAKLIPINSVILSCTASVGNVAINKIPLTTNQQFNSFTCSKEFVPEFLAYYLKSIKSYIETLGGTTTFRFISRKNIAQIEIPMPEIEEQRRIVKKLEKILAKIEEAHAQRQESIEEAQNVIKIKLGELFENNSWDETRVNDIAEKPQYGYTASSTQDKIGPRLLRITDIQNGIVDWENVPYCKCNEVDKYRLTSGDIIFARTGATTGKSFLIKDTPEQTVFASYLIRLKTKSGIKQEFLYWFFQSPQYWNQIMGRQRGSAQPNVNAVTLSTIKLRMPENLKEQGKIVAYLDGLSEKVQALQKLQQEQLQDLEALQQSVLHQAFQGEL